jgi:hypothetical protein
LGRGQGSGARGQGTGAREGAWIRVQGSEGVNGFDSCGLSSPDC